VSVLPGGQLKRNETQQRDNDLLGQIIAFDADDRAIWPAAELQSSLGRQIRSQLLSTLRRPETEDQRELAVLTHSTPAGLETLGDLLQHPHPPVELLRLTKDFAKACNRDPQSPLPPEVSLLLYYACITIALVRCNQRITNLHDDELRDGLHWVVRQPWIDDSLRSLFLQGLDHMRRGRHWWRR
jgi:hypothetical protein